MAFLPSLYSYERTTKVLFVSQLSNLPTCTILVSLWNIHVNHGRLYVVVLRVM